MAEGVTTGALTLINNSFTVIFLFVLMIPDVGKSSFDLMILNSLIIHQVKTNKITTVKEVSIRGLHLAFTSPFLFRLRRYIKIPLCASYFQLSSRCLDIPAVKHCLSCLIYDLGVSRDSHVNYVRLNGFLLNVPTVFRT